MYKLLKGVYSTTKTLASTLLTVLFCTQAFAQCGINAGNGATLCNTGQSVTLTAAVTGGNPNSFTWTSSPASNLPSASSITVSPSVTTTYYVYASGNGCNAYDTVVVTVGTMPPAPSISYTQSNACSSSPINFSANAQGGLTYGWNYGDGTTGSGASTWHNYQAYGTGNSNFTVTLTDTNASGCSNSVTQNITVTQGPSPTLIGGPEVDSMTFNGNLTFYTCAAAAQQNELFTFLNGTSPGAGLTYTILWGDTGVAYNSDTPWASISHLYNRGIFDLTYIVRNTVTGCTDTTVYKVFYGSNPSGGIASPGNTDICGPGTLTFVISNYQNNTPGTIYTITFNDGSPPIVFNTTPPDTITHLFQTSSCGVSSSNGVTTFNNSFAASLTVQNPCGLTAGAVLPIYVSLKPVANYIPPQQVACTGVNQLYINSTTGGMAASSSGCNNATPILWNLTPATGWSITTGNLGSDNGYTGSSFAPSLWTTGSNDLGVTFSTPGTYSMRLVAANSCGPDTIIKTICVTAPPSPTMTVSGLTGLTGCAPASITVTNTTPADTSSCGGPGFAWGITQVSAICTPDNANNYTYTNGTDSASQTAKITFNNQGTYTVALNASNVCGTYPATQTVNIMNPPQVGIAVPATICLGQSITPTSTSLACGAPISAYSWSFAGGTPSTSTNQDPGTVTLGGIGTYAVSLSVSNQCGSAGATQNVAVSGIPVANAGSAKQLCSGGSVQIGAAPVAGVFYSWIPVTGLSSPNVSNPTITLTNNGTAPVAYKYYVTASNAAGCSTTDSVVITAYPIAWAIAGPATNVCAGQSVNLAGTFGGAATSVTWSTLTGGTFGNIDSASTTFTPPLTPGTYTIKLTTNTPAGPCPASSSATTVTVNTEPVAVTGGDTAMCSGATIHIGSTSQAGYTYTWSPSTGLSNIHSSKPSVTLTNNGTTVATQTYQLIASIGTCADTAPVTISVYPQPGANAGPGVSVCGSGAVTLNGSISGSATSAAWSSTSGTFSQPDSLSTVFTPNISSGVAVATLTTSQASGGCASAVSNVNVTVNQLPAVTNTPMVQDICSGSTTQALNLTSSVGGTTYSWTGASTNGATGFIASGTSSAIPAQTLTNSSSAVESINYVITPNANGCTGATANYNITIDPLPTIAALSPQTICSGAASTAVTLSSSVAGTTFSWTASAGADLSGYFPNGTGNIPSQTILNSGSHVDSVVYTITGSANGCSGTSARFVIHINPTPQVTLPAAQSICSGASSAVVNLTSNIVGSTFSWTATGAAGITGYTANGTGNIPAQVLRNTGTTAGNVTYTISASAGGCTGPAQNYIITVNSAPVTTATPASPSVCSGTQVSISISSTIAGATFNWTATAGGGVTGESNGTGSSIQQTLANSSQSVQHVTYIITGTANACSGPADTEVVTVNPNANIQFSTGTQNICSGQYTQVVIISSSTTGASFSWTSEANGINGVTASGTDTIPVQLLINNTSNALTAGYSVTASYAGCTGQTGTFAITVNPQPQVTLPAPQTICSGTATSAVTLTSGIPGTTYTWTASSNNGITGYTVNGTGSNIPSQILTDTSSSQGSVSYIIVPSLNGCTGSPVNYIVTVNSGLVISPVSPQTICSGTNSTPVIPVANIQNAGFSWTAVAGPYISGFTSQGTGDIPGQTISNAGNTVDSIVYTISANASGCTGNPIRYVLTVNPVPQVVLPPRQAICSGSQTSVVNFSSNVSGTTYSWTAVAPPYLTGYLTPGTGSIPSQTITNSGFADDSVVYTITPVANSCQGTAQYYAIVVHPTPTVNINAEASSICSGTQANIYLSSDIAGTTFSWTVNEPASVTGAVNGNGNAISQTITSTSANPETVTYIITPGGTACAGKPDTFALTVNPGINIAFSTGEQNICSGQNTQPVTLSSSVNGVTFSWFSQSNGITGAAASGSNIIPVQTLVNSSWATDSVSYVISAISGNCPVQTAVYHIAVKPQPQVNFPAPQTICSGAATSAVALTSNVPGTTFAWSASADSVTGYTVSGTGATVPSQTLRSIASSQGTVTYTVVPSAGGCAGAPVNYTVIVNSGVVISPVARQTICSGTESVQVTPEANVPNTAFNWTAIASPYLTGYLSQGTGVIPVQTIINTGNTVDSVVYTISADASGCSANPVNFVLHVNPVPEVILPPNQVICSGSQTNVVNCSSNVNGTTYSWTAVASSYLTGYLASGTGNIPAQTITNSGFADDSVVYTITPVANGCPGTVNYYTIVVHPTPVVNINTGASSICSGTQANIYLSSDIAGTTFSWTVNEPASVTGAVNGNGSLISQTITSTSANPETVTYIITPGGTACAGKPDTFALTVNPGINIAFSTGAQNICSGQNTQPVTLSSSVNGVTFSWFSQSNGITGASASGSNIIPVQTLVNSSWTTDSVSYVISAISGNCPVQNAVYHIAVKPGPQVDFPAPQTICSGAATSAVNLSSSIPGTTFAWTASADSVTGYTASGAGATIPSQTLNTSSSTQGVVTYIVVPSANGCAGTPINYTVNVNSGVVISPVAPQTICSGAKSAQVNPVANVPNTSFYWTAVAGPYLTGYLPQGADTIPIQIITNTGNSADSVIYTIHADASGCSANPVNFVLHVNPIPNAYSPSDQAICSGNQSAPVQLTANVDGTEFSWYATASSYLSGYQAYGTGNIPAQVIVNSAEHDDSVTYTITPVAQTCPGPDIPYKILVHPNARMSVTPSSASICSGTETNITLSSDVAGTTFNWIAEAPADITGAVNGNGTTISQTITSTSPTSDTVTYVIIPGGSVCPGSADSIRLIVNPGIQIGLSSGPQSLCTGQSTQAVNLTGSGNGVSLSWVAQANGISGVTASGNNIIPVQTLVNSQPQIDSVNYFITATSTSCPSKTAEYTITVKPNPSVNLPAPQAICSGSSSSAVEFNSSTTGTDYSWTGAASNGITGFIASGNADSIPAFTAHNTGNDTGYIVYTISASANGCSTRPASYTINVYPTPNVSLPGAQTVCNGSTANPVVLASNTTGATFSWTSNSGAGITGATASGTGNIPAQTLSNSTTIPGVVKYTITPSAGSCTGVSAVYTDTVYPAIGVTAPATQVVCSGQLSNAITLTSPVPGATIHWSASIPNGITGAAASGGNTIPTQRLYNNLTDTFPVPLTINYTLSASVTGLSCPVNNTNYSITVLPKPQISFISSVSSGCSPLSVSFEPRTLNYGQPDSLVFIWGDGSANTTVYPNASNPEWYSVNHVFYNHTSAAVTYNVTLKAANGCFDTTITQPVAVMPNAINAFFTASPNTGCAPLTVNFKDQSSGASLLSWCFNYNRVTDSCMGGGVVDSAGSAITQIFTAGTYTVALYATNPFGCAHDTAYQTIVVNPSPAAAFTPSPALCAQTSVSFTPQSTAPQGSFIAQYSWQFGDGGTSLDEQPSHIYNAIGTYNVCLTVTSSSGCSNSTCNPVTIGSRPLADFSDANACLNQQLGQFTNLSSGATSFYWTFGDGAASTFINPTHAYLAAGNYAVTLVGTGNGCNDTAVHYVNIYPIPQAAFTTPAIPGCGLPASMPLTNTSTGAIAYEWNLGNGSTSQFENPVAVYNEAGTFTVMLIASNSYNCLDTATAPITVYAKPNVTANTTPVSGCAPLPAIFSINATNATQFVWNFGDGSNPVATSEPFAEHAYPNPGTYAVTIEVYSAGTCGDTITLPDSVIVHSIPTAGFQYVVTDSAQLNNGTIQFINTSTNSNSYLWDFGDGATSTDTNPSHMFPDVNDFEVMLIATNSYGCSDTALQSLDVVKKSLYVPNAFAPEYSGPNGLVQVWKPAGIGLRTYHAQVFDKWGELLWESDALTPELEPAEGWDGYYQGKLCQQGVYVWKIEATFVDGTIWTGTAIGKDKIAKTIGSVTLIR